MDAARVTLPPNMASAAAGALAGAAVVWLCGSSRAPQSIAPTPCTAPDAHGDRTTDSAVAEPKCDGTTGAVESVGAYTARTLLSAAGRPTASGRGSAEAELEGLVMNYLHAQPDFAQHVTDFFSKLGGNTAAAAESGADAFAALLTVELESCFASYFRHHWDDPDALLRANSAAAAPTPPAAANSTANSSGGPDDAAAKTKKSLARASSKKWGDAHKLIHRKFITTKLKSQVYQFPVIIRACGRPRALTAMYLYRPHLF
jgi:hypothetical protein